MRGARGLVVAFAALLVATAAPGLGAAAAPSSLATYIVVLEPGSEAPSSAADRLSRRYGGEVGFVYAYALRGFSIRTTARAAEALGSNRSVDYVEKDQVVSVDAQTTPTGISRIFAAPHPTLTGQPFNSALDVDGVDDSRVDVDVAVIDTGIDLDHPDLNVVGGTSCVNASTASDCSGTGDDDHYHGTHVAGTAAAVDNDLGVVGVAPGARLWAVKVLNRRGSGTWSGVIAGIDWVVKNGGIEVANLSLGGGYSQAVNDAVARAVTAGVSMVVAAGNSDADASNSSPASEPKAITVSALADFNGAPGGLGSPTCRTDEDDTFANFSNYGAVIDMIAPGVCILSTYPDGKYNTISGTSMASPHVAGAVALLRSMSGSTLVSAESDLKSAGNLVWNDVDDPDDVKEKLLDVSSTTVFDPAFVGDGGGGTDPNSSPVASFTYGCTDLTCSFTDTSTDSDGGWISAWVWAFDDGGTSTVGTPDHTYAAGGTYTVTLTVTDNRGATGTTSQSVTVTAPDGGTTTPTFTGSSTSQGSTWTAIITVTNGIAGVTYAGEWSITSTAGQSQCTVQTNSTTCSFARPGIAKRVSSVTWTYSADLTIQVTVNKP